MYSRIGEIAALVTAVCWTFNAIVFEFAGKRVGSMSVSYIRLYFAFICLTVASFFSRGIVLPIDATAHSWFYLLISGLFGFVLGDMFLFQAFVEIGSRISLLIMSAAPPLTALISFFVMGERISFIGLLGMFLTMVGICIVILSRNPDGNKMEFNRPLRGIIYASIGALGQALGLIFSKIGMGSYNIFAATQIRLVAAFIAYTIIITMQKKWPEIREAFHNKRAIGEIAVGGILGPFIGVVFSLVALKYTATGIVSSITSVSPVIIIPASIIIFKEEVLPKEIIGAFVSIAGVVLLFL